MNSSVRESELPAGMQRIMVTVHGWPDKRNEGKTRVVVVQNCTMARLITTNIVNRLGGLFKLEMRVMDDHEHPYRSDAEILRCQNIIHSVTTGDYAQ